jgi:hypothetical protein
LCIRNITEAQTPTLIGTAAEGESCLTVETNSMEETKRPHQTARDSDVHARNYDTRLALPLVILNLAAWDFQAIKVSHDRLLEGV